MRILLLATAALLPAIAHAQAPRSRPMNEMQGGCSNYATDLHREFAVMTGKAASASASGEVATAPTIRRERATTLRLVPQSTVRFAATPGAQRGGPDSFAGIASLGDLPAGRWRVSANSGVWYDLVANGALLESPEFEMQTQCPTVFKSVAFVNPRRGQVLLQVSGAKAADVRIAVTRDETAETAETAGR